MTCPGSGGAHGGQGGFGVNQRHDNNYCREFVPKPSFGKEGNAIYEGSSGGRGNSTQGGSGGGIVWLSATDTVELVNSKVDVSGQPGSSNQNQAIGSGGGAGGSVQITTKSIVGNGEFDLRGGNGGTGGGGGGSGGRFVNYFTSYFNQSHSSAQSGNWSGSLTLKGGLGGLL